MISVSTVRASARRFTQACALSPALAGVLAITSAAFSSALPTATLADGVDFVRCAPHDQVAAFLQAEHGEALAGWGADPRGLLLELYSDPQDGSWSVTFTGPDGRTCIISWGTAWQDEKGWPA